MVVETSSELAVRLDVFACHYISGLLALGH